MMGDEKSADISAGGDEWMALQCTPLTHTQQETSLMGRHRPHELHRFPTLGEKDRTYFGEFQV